MNGSIWGGCDEDGHYALTTLSGTVIVEIADNPDFGSIVQHGFCLPLVEGCNDPVACNFFPEATANDGTCTYMGEGEISGETEPVEGETYAYEYTPGNADFHYSWTVENGSLIGAAEGEGLLAIEVLWDSASAGQWGTVQVAETDTAGCTGIATLGMEIVLGMAELQGPSPVRVYPIPAWDMISLDWANSGAVVQRVEVVDEVGRVMWYWSTSEPFPSSIDCSEWSEGLYFLMVDGAGFAVPVVR
jgi:hypothetical protein